MVLGFEISRYIHSQQDGEGSALAAGTKTEQSSSLNSKASHLRKLSQRLLLQEMRIFSELGNKR